MNNDKENQIKDTFVAHAFKQPPPGLSSTEYSDWLWKEGWRPSLVIDADTFACKHPDEEGALVHVSPVGVLADKWENGEVKDNDRVIVVLTKDHDNGGEERWFAMFFVTEFTLYYLNSPDVRATPVDLSVLEEPAGPFSGDRPDALAVDMVNRPPHYTRGKYEAIDVIEDKMASTPELEPAEGYLLGQALKYLLRYGHKGDKGEQVAKARWYLDRLTAKLKVWEGGGQ